MFNNPDISVAGHNVISLGLSFCYDQDIYGYIDSDEKSTSFYQARYIVSSQKNDSIAEDLYNKLCSLYGKASSDFGSSSNYTWHDNDISIYLDNSTDVSMLYSWGPGRTKLNILTGTKQYLTELEEQRKKEEMKNENNYDTTTDGL